MWQGIKAPGQRCVCVLSLTALKRSETLGMKSNGAQFFVAVIGYWETVSSPEATCHLPVATCGK